MPEKTPTLKNLARGQKKNTKKRPGKHPFCKNSGGRNF
jgi:hypothetical protein